jgi:hypothetical protein
MCASAYQKLMLAAAVLAPASLLAQSTATPTPTEAAIPEVAAPTKSTLFKLGTGLTRGFQLGGYTGFSIPVVLGVEHHFSPAVSIYGDVYAGLNVLQRRSYGYSRPLVRETGADLGVRYYYNQEKRKLKGRATGPFVGNYLALHSGSSFYPYYRQNSYIRPTYIAYDYSTLNLLWGMQRRIGGHGLLDAYAGAGVANRYSFRSGDFSDYRRRLGLNIEAGIKISLVP